MSRQQAADTDSFVDLKVEMTQSSPLFLGKGDEMEALLAIQLASVVVLGIGAQWLAWRLRLPSILLLLLTGFLIGPVLGWLHPDDLFGELLLPFVSISVGIILFEGGLSLRLSEWRQAGGVIRRLITVGALVTWVLSTAAGYFILGLSIPLALQFGAILVVTGPTVVTPLLRFVRPTGQVGSILRWEGILIDPVGATLALLVFEGIAIGDAQQAALQTFLAISKTLLIGGVSGYLAARLLLTIMKRGWIPDNLQNPVTLVTVIGVFVGANYLQAESGLLATTVMGLTLANQRQVVIRHVVEFKENLGLLLLSSLFILLSARLNRQALAAVGPNSLLFLAFMILIVRPLGIAASTFGTNLSRRERIFMAWMAPRGIVAAAVSSIFALRLSALGEAQAELFVPLAFVVIVGTCAVYGLTALPLAQRLGLSRSSPQGALIIGGQPWAIEMGCVLKSAGQSVLVVDTNHEHIQAARMAGLPAYYGSALADDIDDRFDVQNIGQLVAVTPNDAVNSLAALHFSDFFGKRWVFQLPPKPKSRAQEEGLAQTLRGRLLFSPDAHYDELTRRFNDGGVFKATRLTPEFDYNAYQAQYGTSALPLFLVDDTTGGLAVFTTGKPPAPGPGQTIISLVNTA
jgi:NhaP-type Na+/H+ or K+/H+ antiporter